MYLYDPLIAKIKKKLLGWNLKLISQGGRWVILKSVLSSMSIYLLQVLSPPVSVLNQIDKLISNFFGVLLSLIKRCIGHLGNLFVFLGRKEG